MKLLVIYTSILMWLFVEGTDIGMRTITEAERIKESSECRALQSQTGDFKNSKQPLEHFLFDEEEIKNEEQSAMEIEFNNSGENVFYSNLPWMDDTECLLGKNQSANRLKSDNGTVSCYHSNNSSVEFAQSLPSEDDESGHFSSVGNSSVEEARSFSGRKIQIKDQNVVRIVKNISGMFFSSINTTRITWHVENASYAESNSDQKSLLYDDNKKGTFDDSGCEVSPKHSEKSEFFKKEDEYLEPNNCCYENIQFGESARMIINGIVDKNIQRSRNNGVSESFGRFGIDEGFDGDDTEEAFLRDEDHNKMPKNDESFRCWTYKLPLGAESAFTGISTRHKNFVRRNANETVYEEIKFDDDSESDDVYTGNDQILPRCRDLKVRRQIRREKQSDEAFYKKRRFLERKISIKCKEKIFYDIDLEFADEFFAAKEKLIHRATKNLTDKLKISNMEPAKLRILRECNDYLISYSHSNPETNVKFGILFDSKVITEGAKKTLKFIFHLRNINLNSFVCKIKNPFDDEVFFEKSGNELQPVGAQGNYFCVEIPFSGVLSDDKENGFPITLEFSKIKKFELFVKLATLKGINQFFSVVRYQKSDAIEIIERYSELSKMQIAEFSENVSRCVSQICRKNMWNKIFPFLHSGYFKDDRNAWLDLLDFKKLKCAVDMEIRLRLLKEEMKEPTHSSDFKVLLRSLIGIDWMVIEQNVEEAEEALKNFLRDLKETNIRDQKYHAWGLVGLNIKNIETLSFYHMREEFESFRN